jgi:hypothetical protein
LAQQRQLAHRKRPPAPAGGELLEHAVRRWRTEVGDGVEAPRQLIDDRDRSATALGGQPTSIASR